MRRRSRWRSLDQTKQNLIQIYIFVGLAYFALFGAVLLPLGNLLSLIFTFEINYNEGWNVYNADRLIHGEIVYDDNYWRINNYPIGSFLIVAAANVLIHDLLLSGRLVALVAFAAIAVFAAITVRRFGGGRTDAVFGAGGFIGSQGYWFSLRGDIILRVKIFPDGAMNPVRIMSAGWKKIDDE